ncbi:MAG: DUF1800 family protein [Gemmataceae bacterium]
MPDTDNNRNNIDPTWAWRAYQPTRQNPWDLKKAGHLFRRAGFGASLPELKQAIQDGPERAINKLLRGGEGQTAFERQANSLTASIKAGNNGRLATAWWLYKMAYTPHPLREKLTLFWHDHFATSNLKVNNTTYMLGQYQLMRQHAQGNFGTMLQAITLDPAMLVWLDTTDSRRGQPNENYARELMELFSLGINNPQHPDRANYTEGDIREAARAFTGYRIQNGQGVFRENLHDKTEKRVLGQRGRFRGEDIVRICLAQPACAYFIVGKLFQFLISETIQPTPQIIAPLATAFRRNYDIGAVVETILRSNLFFSAQTYRTKVKSPVEYVVGIVRGLQARVGTTQLELDLEGLGQRLFYPPSVAGWDEGRAWLNGQTLLFRHNLALKMTSTEDGDYGSRCDPARLVRDQNNLNTDTKIVDFFLSVFLQGDVAANARTRLLGYLEQARRQSVPRFWTEQDATDHRIRALCHLVLTQPEFQLN